MPKFDTDIFILPAHWASYIINCDHSGLSHKEKKEVDEWFEENGNPNIVDVGESYFSHTNDANMLGGDVADYTALIEVANED